MKNKKTAMLLAILAAALYALNIPFSKLLITEISPVFLAGFLYLGAGLGMLMTEGAKKLAKRKSADAPISKRDMPYVAAMVLLDIAAPILLMLGIERTSSASVSLLNNFEIVATSFIALIFFREKISALLWSAITLVSAASLMLGIKSTEVISFDIGALLVLGACICWGFENNCTKKLSEKSSEQIVVIKGIFSGLGGIITAFAAGEDFPRIWILLPVMLLGFVSYGLSINFYIMAQSGLGAAKTGAFYSVAPFIGVALCFILNREQPNLLFWPALAIMLAAMLIMIKDTLRGDSKPDCKIAAASGSENC